MPAAWALRAECCRRRTLSLLRLLQESLHTFSGGRCCQQNLAENSVPVDNGPNGVEAGEPAPTIEKPKTAEAEEAGGDGPQEEQINEPEVNIESPDNGTIERVSLDDSSLGGQDDTNVDNVALESVLSEVLDGIVGQICASNENGPSHDTTNQDSDKPVIDELDKVQENA